VNCLGYVKSECFSDQWEAAQTMHDHFRVYPLTGHVGDMAGPPLITRNGTAKRFDAVGNTAPALQDDGKTGSAADRTEANRIWRGDCCFVVHLSSIRRATRAAGALAARPRVAGLRVCRHRISP
jgi:hypothetical protein